MTRIFHLLVAVIFAVVALLHMLRLEFGATVVVSGTYELPIWISWPGMIVTAALSIWGFRLWDLDRRRART